MSNGKNIKLSGVLEQKYADATKSMAEESAATQTCGAPHRALMRGIGALMEGHVTEVKHRENGGNSNGKISLSFLGVKLNAESARDAIRIILVFLIAYGVWEIVKMRLRVQSVEGPLKQIGEVMEKKGFTAEELLHGIGSR